MARIRSIDVSALPNQNEVTDGCCVYLIQEGDGGPVKIGVANHAARRLSMHQTGNPRPLRFVAAVGAARQDCIAIERAALLAFRDRLIRGEWFEASARDEIIAFLLRYVG